MDGRDQFQLLPGTKKKLGIRVPGENRFLYIGSAILGAVLVTSFAMSRYENNLLNQISSLNQQIVDIDQKRDLKAEDTLRITKQQLETTASLLNDHIYWTRGLYRIASIIHNEVQLESFSYSSGTNSISLEASASSYTVLAKQIASFLSDPIISDIVLGQIGTSQDNRIIFDIGLTFDEAKLIKNPSTE